MERKRKISFNNDIQSDQIIKKQKEIYIFDNEEQNNVKAMNQDDFDELGQERTAINFNDHIRIASFNIDDEMEEGHHDETKCVQWKKKDVIYQLKINLSNNNNDYDDDEEINDNQFNEINALKSLLSIMQPTETVVHTIKRLSATSTRSKQRIKQRKPFSPEISISLPMELTSEGLKKTKFLLEEMTGLADQFISNGQLNIYQETYEQLQIKFNHLQSFNSNLIQENLNRNNIYYHHRY